MTRRFVTILAMAVLSAWAANDRAAEEPAGAPKQTGAITGLVVDWKGRPVSGAAVWWNVSYQEKFEPTRSDADGRFRLPGLKFDKPVTVWADAPSLARERRDDVHIFAGNDRDIGRLALLPGTRMRGRVIDAHGKPIAGAGIKLDLYRYRVGHSRLSWGTEWTFKAAGDGRFATPPLPAGDGHFSLSAPGKVHTFVDKKAEPGTLVVDLGDITLPDEMPVAGIITDGEGKPAPGVEVIPDYDWQHSVKTDKDGRFVVHGFGKDLKQLIVRSNEYFAPKPFDAGPGRADLKLTVIKAYGIHGTAVDAETGRPVPIDTVRLCMVVRDADGHVSLVG
jgi:hypothetical protein